MNITRSQVLAAVAVLVVLLGGWALYAHFNNKEKVEDPVGTKPTPSTSSGDVDLDLLGASSADPDDEDSEIDMSTSPAASVTTTQRSAHGTRMAYKGATKGNDTFDQSAHVSSGVRTSEFAAGTGDGTRKLVADASQVISNSLQAQRRLKDNSSYAMFSSQPKHIDDRGRSIWTKTKLAPIDESLLDNRNPFTVLPPAFYKHAYENTRDRGLVANRNPTVNPTSHRPEYA